MEWLLMTGIQILALLLIGFFIGWAVGYEACAREDMNNAED
jgi:hypothetical protein